MEEPSSMRRIEEFRPVATDRTRIRKNEPKNKKSRVSWRCGAAAGGPENPESEKKQ
ncbi:hypothetical protein [Streptomyces sp. HUAS TT20]|uniref:hypothetical protein n=1 Tax=Streptomyces sp. HUAS TT20 TaxID=3447509 RepID=UPI0021DA13EF|nr:hypothetical protein [Streptomyces sp. HUAS 15-9]UXY30946.1 hypothetical protein N8I87_33270 [Streptomyces sp. HUAS 15-9]